MSDKKRKVEEKETKNKKKRVEDEQTTYRELFAEEFGVCHETMRGVKDQDISEEDFYWSDESEDVLSHFCISCDCGVALRADPDKLEEADSKQETTPVHEHHNWKEVYGERKLAEKLCELMDGIDLESEGQAPYELLHFTHVDGGKTLPSGKVFYLVDPNKDGTVTMEEMRIVLKDSIHPKVVQEGGDVNNLEARWSSYCKFDDLFKDVDVKEAGDESDEENSDDEDIENEDDNAETKKHMRKVIANMKKADLRRLTWIVFFADGMAASPYPVYLMGVSSKTGNLIGLQSTLVWT
jgi:hypothetical protein